MGVQASLAEAPSAARSAYVNVSALPATSSQEHSPEDDIKQEKPHAIPEWEACTKPLNRMSNIVIYINDSEFKCSAGLKKKPKRASELREIIRDYFDCRLFTMDTLLPCEVKIFFQGKEVENYQFIARHHDGVTTTLWRIPYPRWKSVEIKLSKHQSWADIATVLPCAATLDPAASPHLRPDLKRRCFL